MDQMELSYVGGEEESWGNVEFDSIHEKTEINQYYALCDQIGT